MIVVKCDSSQVSDGQHTFGELYSHRCYLFAALMRCFPKESWKSLRHDDGSMHDGWFITGMKLPTGETITYHMPEVMWTAVHSIRTLARAPKWDGHTSRDTIHRLDDWLHQ